MGNSYSIIPFGGANTSGNIVVNSETMESTSATNDGESEENKHQLTEDEDPDRRSQGRDEEMDEFRKQLNIKRELRKEILSRHRTEKEKLKFSLSEETKAKLRMVEKNKSLYELLRLNNIEVPEDLQSTSADLDVIDTVSCMREELDNIKSSNIKLRVDLADTNGALQGAYSEIADLSAQNTESIKQISALKEVISVSKTLIGMREQQLNELKNKLAEIEKSLADREASMLSTDLRQEYERQLQNIRTLRGLYEERARLAEVTRQGLLRELEEQKALSQAESNKSIELANKVQNLETEIVELKETVESKSEQIRSSQIETQGLKAEMTAVNKLFSQVLLGYKAEQDLDKLVQRLEENHGLLTQMAEKHDDGAGSSALPKLLLELVSQVEEEVEKLENDVEKTEESKIKESNYKETNEKNSSKAEEIVQNLPKVWRVLMELLSHQNIPDDSTKERVTTCYKSVETNSGPVLVPSVSQTYIRLKELIVEKLSLIKDVNKMKQLNVHLESRLEEQERRLCLVTTELSKTWHVVGRLRRHHHQLHTHEKILKYELQQKRKLLNELKEELVYCREKWDQAREKNTQSEKDWRKLRAEFSSRKNKSISSSINNSAESGYSDEKPSDESSDSNDESENLSEPPRSTQKTVHDSSTDIHAAEREDPVSDMLDVAELPLDSQDGEEHQEMSVCNNLIKTEISMVETEDEAGDMSIETISQDDSGFKTQLQEETQKQDSNENTQTSSNSQENNNAVTINPIAILESINRQNERLAKRDKKFDDLEKSSAALLNQTKNTVKLGNQINETLDCLMNRPSSSKDADRFGNQSTKNNESSDNCIVDRKEENGDSDQQQPNQNISCNISSDLTGASKSCEKYEDTIPGSSSLQIDKTHAKQRNYADEINTENSEENASIEVALKKDTDVVLTDDSEASTSEQNHEARFAARELRLKSLEEQTKSLVNRVNKTKSKGVKIHYKLEELHNIYGSENSRSGTPFDENDDCSESNDDKSSHE